MISSEKRLDILKKLANHVSSLEQILENHIIANLYTQMYVFMIMVNDDEDLKYEDVLDNSMYNPGVIRIARTWSVHSITPVLRFKRWVLAYVKHEGLKLTDIVYIFPDTSKSYYSPKHAVLLTDKCVRDLPKEHKVYFDIFVNSLKDFRKLSPSK